jgi:hypothetical protein
MGWEVMDWVRLALNKIWWHFVVNMLLMKQDAPQNAENFLTC